MDTLDPITTAETNRVGETRHFLPSSGPLRVPGESVAVNDFRCAYRTKGSYIHVIYAARDILRVRLVTALPSFSRARRADRKITSDYRFRNAIARRLRNVTRIHSTIITTIIVYNDSTCRFKEGT